MKIRRYFAPDMRQALRKVREEQGPDAVILSNRRVDGGVEIVAAVDYDEAALWDDAGAPPDPGLPGLDEPVPAAAPEPPAAREPAPRSGAGAVEWTQEPAIQSLRDEVHAIRDMLQHQLSALAWGELGRRKPNRAALFRKLIELDLNPALARQVAAEAGDGADMDALWRRALGMLARRLRVIEEGVLETGGVVALVGPTGVGKTTTVAKLAARYALTHGAEQVGLVTTDTYRVGAVEQLRTYGRIMGIPVRVAKSSEELRGAVEDLFDRRLVVVDTAGLGQRDTRLPDQLQRLQDGAAVLQTYLVLAATAHAQALEDSIDAFQGGGLDGCVLTKLDEATGLGHVLSAVSRRQLPVAYITDGQQVPEDLHAARAPNLVTRAVARYRRAGGPAEEHLELAFGGGPLGVEA
jgi:flagellar biosynthesis protein FlhF